jgi:hypothetical protein
VGPSAVVGKAVVGLALVALLGAGCQKNGTSGEADALPTITTSKVETRRLVQAVDVDGTLGFGNKTTRSTSAAGTVTAIATEGSVVTVGQKLYSIDARPTFLMAGTIELSQSLGPKVSESDATALRTLQGSIDQAIDSEKKARDELDSVLQPRAKKADTSSAKAQAQEALANAVATTEANLLRYTNDIAANEAALAQRQADVQKAEDDLANTRNDTGLLTAVTEAQDTLSDAAKAIEESTINDSNEAVRKAQLSVTRASEAVTGAERGIVDADAAVADAKATKNGLQPDANSVFSEKLRQAEATLRTAEATAREARAVLLSKQDAVIAASADVDKANRDVEKANATIEKNRRTKERAEQKFVTANANVATAPTKVRQSQAALEAAQRALATAQRTLDASKIQLETERTSGVRAKRTAEAKLRAAEVSNDVVQNPTGVSELRAALGRASQAVERAREGYRAKQFALTGTKPEGEVRAVEQFLVDIGVAKRSEVGVDGSWTESTTKAVERWQRKIGVQVDGTVQANDLVPVGSEGSSVRIASRKTEVGAQVQSGSAILETTSPIRAVHVDLVTERRELAKIADEVPIKLPNDITTTGKIQTIGSVAEKGIDANGADNGKRTFDVEISLEDQSVAWEGAPVTVSLIGQVRENAMAVPINALVALAEGGFGVEKIGKQGSEYVQIQTGLFADGWVEIIGDGIKPGDDVTVAS